MNYIACFCENYIISPVAKFISTAEFYRQTLSMTSQGWKPNQTMIELTTEAIDEDDIETKAYMAEMKRQMTRRLREEHWEKTQKKVAFMKDIHYKKWKRVCFIKT